MFSTTSALFSFAAFFAVCGGFMGADRVVQGAARNHGSSADFAGSNPAPPAVLKTDKRSPEVRLCAHLPRGPEWCAKSGLLREVG